MTGSSVPASRPATATAPGPERRCDSWGIPDLMLLLPQAVNDDRDGMITSSFAAADGPQFDDGDSSCKDLYAGGGADSLDHLTAGARLPCACVRAVIDTCA